MAFFMLFIALLATVSGEYTLFSLEDEICCDGVRHKTYGEEEGVGMNSCCGKDVIPYSPQQDKVCCGNKILELPSYPSWYCCQGELIDTTENTCYDDVIVALPEDAKLENRTLPCRNADEEYEFYNYDEKLCCEKNLFDKSPTSDCCGSEEYDLSKSICCVKYSSGESIIVDIDEGVNTAVAECCGDHYYDRTNQICCNDNAITFDKSTVIPSCCGNSVYDMSTSICCGLDDDAVVHVIGNTVEWDCCGMEAYNTSARKHLCCYDKLYDHKTQACCIEKPATPESTDKVEAFLTDLDGNDYIHTDCCYGELYDIRHKICCYEGLRDIPEAGLIPLECCGDGFIYNITTQECFNNEIVEKGADEALCINSETKTYSIYNIKLQTCCSPGPSSPAEVCDLAEEDIVEERYTCCYTDEDIQAANPIQ
ncbi:hypothetical protein CHUAL_013333 [Chamberlinius hualienensis]